MRSRQVCISYSAIISASLLLPLNLSNLQRRVSPGVACQAAVTVTLRYLSPDCVCHTCTTFLPFPKYFWCWRETVLTEASDYFAVSRKERDNSQGVNGLSLVVNDNFIQCKFYLRKRIFTLNCNKTWRNAGVKKKKKVLPLVYTHV